MDDRIRQLWDEMGELLNGLDSKFSGREEAAMGSYGRRLLRRIIGTGMLPTHDLHAFQTGFDSLTSDYRISNNDLRAMNLTYIRLRLKVFPEDKENPDKCL